MRARDLMTEAPVTISPKSTVREAARLLDTLDIRHLPVVNEEHELVGMVSDRDLRSLSVPAFAGAQRIGNVQTALDASVSSVMTTEVLSVEEEADAKELVDLMLDFRVGAIPVTDGDGTLVGIVSYIDVLRTCLNESAAE